MVVDLPTSPTPHLRPLTQIWDVQEICMRATSVCPKTDDLALTGNYYSGHLGTRFREERGTAP